MFNKKEDQKTVSGSKNQSPSLNMISEGTTFKGTIKTENDIRIAGKTEGEMSSKGKLIVTSGGLVEGGVDATDADIAGEVKGEIRISKKLTLRKSAVINGDIYAKTLIVEEGAEMNGTCRMGAEATNSKKPENSSGVASSQNGSKPRKEYKASGS